MPITVKYTGTVEPYFETAVTGKPTKWSRGDTDERTDADAALLLASGLFEPAFKGAAVEPILPISLANPSAAMLADTRTMYELTTTRTLYKSNGVNLEPVAGSISSFGVPYQVSGDGVVMATSCVYYGVRCKTAGTIALYDNVAASGDTLLGATAMTAEQIISWGGAGRLCFVGIFADITGGTYEVLLNPIA